jgi:succinoglycan biosynthesis transport protein ExoP
MNSNSHPSGIESSLDPSFGWNIGTITGVVKQRMLALVLLILSALALAGGYLALTPAVYEARTVVQVEQSTQSAIALQDQVREDLKTVEILKTIEQNLSSTALLLRVAKTTKLEQDPRFTNERAGLASRVLGLIKKNAKESRTEAALLRTMSDRVKVALRRGTRLIDVTVHGQNAELARDLSLAVVEEYTKLYLEQKLAASKPVYGHLVGEAERLKRQLDASEQKLQSYREDKRAVSLEQTQNIVVETLKDLNKSLSEARSIRIKIESDVATLQSRPNDVSAYTGASATSDVLALKQRVAEQEAALASLTERYDSNNPKYLQARSEIEKLKLSLSKALKDAAEMVKASLSAAMETEQKLLVALQEQERRALELNKISVHYNALNREVESDRAMYEAVLKQLKETQIVQGGEQGGIRIVEPAIVADRPVSPKKSMILAVALILGMTVGVALCVAPTVLRAPFMNSEDAEQQLGIPSVGMIPKVRLTGGVNEIYLVDNSRTLAAEALRSLRASLCLSEGRSYMFCSALPGDGKTFCAVNFAAALALEGHRTLLIDADLRLPSIAGQLFGKELPGLADVVKGKMTLSEAVRPAKIDNLFVLTAGLTVAGPAELLASPSLAGMMESAMASYDRVVIDSAPVLAVSDALRLSAQVQHTVLVLCAAKTPGRAVARALHLLAKAKGRPPVGFVLNQVTSGPVGYGSYGSYT